MTVAMSQWWVRRNKTLRAGSSKDTKEVKQISTYSVAQATLKKLQLPSFHLLISHSLSKAKGCQTAIHVLGALQVYSKKNKIKKK